MIRNPVLPGFNADPSLLRVGDDYYLATSTFEWFPGVAIYHSRDLAHWRLLTHALTRRSQLDLRGAPGSGGIWAPCLRWNEAERLFYLLYTDVRNSYAETFDVHNWLVTAPAAEGPWSERVYLNSSGFDPSILFDDDGRAWVANLEWEFRKGYEHPGWIVLQEYSSREQRLVGPIRRIYHGGSDRGCLEGPNLYRFGGRYYLVTAEGGTGYGHAAILARSDRIEGPYEPDPAGPLVSAANEPFSARGERDFLKPRFYNPGAVLQKTGHASIVETRNGEWYIAHLCARPLVPELRCFLNRETALRRCFWTADGWLRAEGGRLPVLQVPGPSVPGHPFPPDVPGPGPGRREDFDAASLPADFYTLRVPADPAWLSLTERPGYLRLRGRESLRSFHEQSLVARRVQHFDFSVATAVEFRPESWQQMAGLIIMIGTENWYYLRIYRSESLASRAVGVMTCTAGRQDELLENRVKVDPDGTVCLRAEVGGGRTLRFSWAYGQAGAAVPAAGSWNRIGPDLDASRISDECSAHEAFSGTFVGVCVQDLSGRFIAADFDWFDYRGRE